MSFDTGGLRSDDRQWLIYDDEALGAVMRGLEAWALAVCGNMLENHHHDPLRGIGSFMKKVANQRLVLMKRTGGAQEATADWVLLISKWAADKTPWTSDVERALDEFHAAVYRLDSRVNGAGVVAPVGVHRQAVRGD